MADLLTHRELALWTQREEAEVTADAFASEVIDKVSQMAQFLGGHPDWTLEPGPNQAPFDVRMVVLQVCKRTYGNPNQVVQEGSVGPIGGDRVLDAAALLTTLTDSERKVLTQYNPDGDSIANEGELFTLETTRGAQTTALAVTLYMGDDQQVNLESSADPREWMIPVFAPGDVGDPNRYA